MKFKSYIYSAGVLLFGHFKFKQVYCLETQTGWPALVTLLIRVVQFPLQQHLKAELQQAVIENGGMCWYFHR